MGGGEGEAGRQIPSYLYEHGASFKKGGGRREGRGGAYNPTLLPSKKATHQYCAEDGRGGARRAWLGLVRFLRDILDVCCGDEEFFELP